MNVRSVPNKTPTCAFSRFPVAPKGHPSAVDVPLLGYLFLPFLQQKSLYQQPAGPSWPRRLASFGTVAGARKSCTFHTSRQKLKISSNLPGKTAGTAAVSAAPASVRVWNHWKPPPGVKRAELVWSLFIYPSFNLNSMFEMRPVMLLSAVVLWLKWEKPIYLFLSPRQWPFFCVQMLQCVDNIPVGFGGGLSQCWWHFDPPPPPSTPFSRS